jgi:hypothetical protein
LLRRAVLLLVVAAAALGRSLTRLISSVTDASPCGHRPGHPIIAVVP